MLQRGVWYLERVSLLILRKEGDIGGTFDGTYMSRGSVLEETALLFCEQLLELSLVFISLFRLILRIGYPESYF